MDKSTTKKRNNYNQTAIKVLTERYDVTDRLVRMAITGERSSHTAIQIKEEYEILCRVLKQKEEEALSIISKNQ